MLRVKYRTIEFGDTDIHVRMLRDKQQFEDKEGEAEKLGISSAMWPLFGVIWESGEVLARAMFNFDIEGKRILEIGCGIGLPSLVLNSRSANISATDYHPEAKHFLNINTDLNNDKRIPFFRTGWSDSKEDMGAFDLVIGSDLLYERYLLDDLVAFIGLHSKNKCEVIIVDPGRGHLPFFSKKMTSLGFTQKIYETVGIAPPENFQGQIVRYTR